MYELKHTGNMLIGYKKRYCLITQWCIKIYFGTPNLHLDHYNIFVIFLNFEKNIKVFINKI